MAIITQITNSTDLVKKITELNKQDKGYKAIEYIAIKLNLQVSNQDIWDTIHACVKLDSLAEMESEFDGLL